MSRRLRLGAAAVTIAAVAAAGAGLVATSGASAEAPAAVHAAEPVKDWTLMVYDVADTQNIADDMITNLADWAALPEQANVNVVALVDLPEQDSPDYPSATLPGVAPFSTAKLLVLDDGKWNEVRDYGEVSMGRPDVLAGFVEEAAGRFPAAKYGLVLSDHGSGAAGGYYDEGPPGRAHLDVASLRSSLIQGMGAAGIDRFEFIDHDACLMSNFETASALGPLAESMVASEEVTFGSQTLSDEGLLALGDDVDGAEWGRINNEAYGDYADQATNGWGAFTAAAVVDGDAMAGLDAAVQSFSDVAVAHMDEIAPAVGRARADALEFVTGLDPGTGSFDLVDLGDFLRHLTDVPDDVAVARDAVFAALEAAVVSQVTRTATQQATGLNVFFPQYTQFADTYLEQQIGPPGWNAFVQAYLDASAGSGGTGGTGGGSDAPTGAAFTSDQAQVLEQSEEGILIAGQLADGTSGSVTSSETQVYTGLDGVQALAIDLPAYLDAGGVGQVQGVWSYQLTAVQNGSGEPVPVSSIYQAQAGGLIGTFYASYTPDGGEAEDVQFRVLLGEDGSVEGVTVTSAGDGGSAQVDLEGGTLTPYYIVADSDGYSLTPAATSVPVTPDFRISFPRLPQGTAFDMGVVVGDVDGGYDGAFVSASVTGGGNGRGRGALRVQDAQPE